jgi:hypothetical protein
VRGLKVEPVVSAVLHFDASGVVRNFSGKVHVSFDSFDGTTGIGSDMTLTTSESRLSVFYV